MRKSFFDIEEVKEPEEITEIEEEEDNSLPLSPKVKTLIILGFLVVIGVFIAIVIDSYQEKKESEEVTIEKIESFLNKENASYDDYVNFFRMGGIVKPIASFTYNVKMDETKRKELDPLADDVYVGFEENETLQANLFKVREEYLFLLYHPKTKEVKEVIEWGEENIELSLNIHKIRGEKAVLAKEAIDSNDPVVFQKNKKEIEKRNQELLKLYEQLQENY